MNFIHLIGTKYTLGGNSVSEGFDCASLCKHVLTQMGFDVDKALPTTYADVDEAWKDMEARFHLWKEVGKGVHAATRRGDVIFHSDGCGLNHVSTLIQEVPKLVISTSLKRGVYCIDPYRLNRVKSVWRLRDHRN